MAKIFELQSSNYTEIQLTATADIAAGDLVIAGVSSNVFTTVDVLDTERYTGILKAEKVLCQKDAVAIVAGEPIYLIVATNIVTNVADLNVLVGFAQADALSGDATCYITYDGNAEWLKA
jgi:predicted RecA/RadA family phage recombinase